MSEPTDEAVSVAFDAWKAATWTHATNLEAVRSMLAAAYPLIAAQVRAEQDAEIERLRAGREIEQGMLRAAAARLAVQDAEVERLTAERDDAGKAWGRHYSKALAEQDAATRAAVASEVSAFAELRLYDDRADRLSYYALLALAEEIARGSAANPEAGTS